MEKLKKFDMFSDEYRLNENWLTNAFDQVLAYFKRKFSGSSWWLPLLQFLVKKGHYKGKVKIYMPNNKKINIPSESEINKMSIEDETDDDFKSAGSIQSEQDLAFEAHNLQHARRVRDVFPEEVQDEIKFLFRMKLKNPKSHPNLFVWGAPGIGKSESVRAVCEELGLFMIEVNLANCSPEDFIGIPEIVTVATDSRGKDIRRTSYNVPIIMPWDNCESLGLNGGIMFLDEMNNATPKVLDASLNLALDGTIPTASYQLPSKWIIIAAGNRKEDADVTDMGFRMSNRFKHMNMITDAPHWIKWASNNPDIDGDLIGFIKFSEEWLHKMDPDDEQENWPSPRTWVKANNDYVLRKEEAGGKLPRQKIVDIFTDYVGPQAAGQFAAYLDLKDKFNYAQVQDVYENGAKAKATLKGLNVHEQSAAIFSIAFFKRNKKVTLQEMKNVIDWAMTLDNFENTTLLISFFKKVHPYIKTDEPYRDIYQDYLNLWHEDKYGKEFIDKVEGEGDNTPPDKDKPKGKKK